MRQHRGQRLARGVVGQHEGGVGVGPGCRPGRRQREPRLRKKPLAAGSGTGQLLQLAGGEQRLDLGLAALPAGHQEFTSPREPSTVTCADSLI